METVMNAWLPAGRFFVAYEPETGKIFIETELNCEIN
jgi:hypothetical protein